MSFPNASVPTNVPVHPTPLYEAALSFGIFACANYFFPLPPLAAAWLEPPLAEDDRFNIFHGRLFVARLFEEVRDTGIDPRAM